MTIIRGYATRRDTLLIEPVWNRNKSFPGVALRDSSSLLIEPVWNRNGNKTVEHIVYRSLLLIEPVWNRNVGQMHCCHATVESAFNRTSMESKLEFQQYTPCSTIF